MTKLRNALKRVRLMPGHRLLEIGSGWGALSRLACVEYGANVTALTLSKNQIKYSRELAAKLQISTNLKYFLEDYRRHEIHKECIYDRVMSIGMLEHVGLWQLKSYFCEISRLLKPDGIALIHTISRRHAGVTNPWIERHIFPGGYIAQDAEILKAAEDAGLSITEHSHVYAPANYITTLQHWHCRFCHSWPLLHKRGYPLHVRRTYEFYFAASEAAFRELDMRAVQYIFRKKIVGRL